MNLASTVELHFWITLNNFLFEGGSFQSFDRETLWSKQVIQNWNGFSDTESTYLFIYFLVNVKFHIEQKKKAYYFVCLCLIPREMKIMRSLYINCSLCSVVLAPRDFVGFLASICEILIHILSFHCGGETKPPLLHGHEPYYITAFTLKSKSRNCLSRHQEVTKPLAKTIHLQKDLDFHIQIKLTNPDGGRPSKELWRNIFLGSKSCCFSDLCSAFFFLLCPSPLLCTQCSVLSCPPFWISLAPPGVELKWFFNYTDR